MRMGIDHGRLRRFAICAAYCALLLPGLVLCAPAAVDAPAPDRAAATRAFERLAGLVGDWRAITPEGSTISVNYRLSAAGSVLVETWAMPSGRESMTLYHLDDDALIATHYCPQGNQPRLRLRSTDDAGRMVFAFRDGSNLGAADAAHQHAMWLDMETPEKFLRSETYVGNRASAEEIAAAEAGIAQLFQRVVVDAPAR